VAHRRWDKWPISFRISIGGVLAHYAERLDRWPVVVGFVLDPDEYLIEIIQHDGPPPGE